MNDLKVSDLMKILNCLNTTPGIDSCPWQLGSNYFIRTVTMYQVGRLIAVTEKELVLENASWVADTGRFNEALKTGELNEVEPFVDNVIVNRSAIIDATLWGHDLPECVK